MATDAQIEANQANAQKSTGPRTMEGKMTSRRNALKHGLASEGDVLPIRDEKKFKERLACWSGECKPQSDMELYQLETAVFATVQLDRCRRHEMAEIGRRRRVAEENWEATQAKRVNACVEHWTTRPAECVAQLEQFTRGCDSIVATWNELGDALKAKEFWSVGEAWMAMRLLGWPPEMFHEGNSEVAALRTFLLAANPNPDCDEVDMFFAMDTSSLEPEARMAACRAKLPSREFAREALWSTMDAEFDRLEPLREALWENADGPALREKIDLATFDDSPAGILRRRYQTASQHDMNRCLKQLAEQGRAHAARCEAEQERQNEVKAAEKAVKEAAKWASIRAVRNEAKSWEPIPRGQTTSDKSASVAQTVKPAPTSPPNQPSGPIGGAPASAAASEGAVRVADETKKTT